MKKYSKMTPYELLKDLNLYDELPVDPFVVAEKMGVEVSHIFDSYKISQETEGDIGVGAKKPYIWINPLHRQPHRKFIMAHLLGHIVNNILPNIKESENLIHSVDASNLILHRSRETSFREYSNNTFAMELLMPKEKIIEETQKYTKGEPVYMQLLIDHMAELFGVTVNTMSVRLLRLGVIK